MSAPWWSEHAQLLRHTQVVSIGKVISDLAITNPVPMNVLDLESFTGRLNIHQVTAVCPLAPLSSMSTAHAASNDNRLTVADHIDDLHFPVRERGENVLQVLCQVPLPRTMPSPPSRQLPR